MDSITFIPSKKTIDDFNAGNKYVNYQSSPNADDFNNIIESQLYTQGLANSPDTSGVNNVGVPSVSVRERADGTAQFVFKNLKGEKGDSGVGDAKLTNDYGDSDENGYTQATINEMVGRPNLLINGFFRVNQRGQQSYNKNGSYTVDRWIQRGTGTVTRYYEHGVRLTAENSNDILGIFQSINDWKYLVSKRRTLTLSAKINFASVSNNTRFYIGVGFTDRNSYTFGDTAFISEQTKPKVNDIYTVTFTVSDSIYTSAATYMNCFVGFTTGATAGDTVGIEWVKLEFGDIATTANPKRYDEELRDCGYYYRRYNPSETAYGWFMQGVNHTTTEAYFIADITMRQPKVKYYGGVAILQAGRTIQLSSIDIAHFNHNSIAFKAVASSSALTAGYGCFLISNNDSSAYVELDGEIY